VISSKSHSIRLYNIRHDWRIAQSYYVDKEKNVARRRWTSQTVNMTKSDATVERASFLAKDIASFNSEKAAAILVIFTILEKIFVKTSRNLSRLLEIFYYFLRISHYFYRENSILPENLLRLSLLKGKRVWTVSDKRLSFVTHIGTRLQNCSCCVSSVRRRRARKIVLV